MAVRLPAGTSPILIALDQDASGFISVGLVVLGFWREIRDR
ncbi:hypothetical protein OIU74_027439 [Salix koriyanagi]|uniref:Uncharacterized protein n=1 Tax=Salix koriyanagi TaxID=2511006 RepID=A0A9Q0VQR0_9ROSI|nr:hypothetical protein OIU74_027439 [Salix koriyanagi]